MSEKVKQYGKLIFISGGVRSGKSSFAESIAIQHAKKLDAPLYYIATSKADDAEMEYRIERHQADRLESGYAWQTYEMEQNLAERIKTLPVEGVVLLDCLTVLSANELFSEFFEGEDLLGKYEAVKENILKGLLELQRQVSYLIIVSNEIHHEYSDDQYVQIYQKLLGELHQQLVKQSSASYLVEHSVIHQMK